jgi:hypothetical protein
MYANNLIIIAVLNEIEDEVERAVVHLGIITRKLIRVLGTFDVVVCLYWFVNHSVKPSE